MTDEYLTLTEVAKLAEVGISAASNWRSRHSDFPPPHVLAGQEKFAADEITRWLTARRIPKNALKGDEPPGTTYGDRLLRTRRPVENVRTTEPAQTRLLWSAMNELRGQHDAVLAVEHILGLLYVKKSDPRRWQSLASETNWAAMRDLLIRSEPPTWPGAPRIRLLSLLDSVDRTSLRAVIRVIDGIDLDDIGAATGQLLEQFERSMGRLGGQFTPPFLVRGMIELLGQDLSGRVYDPFCGSGELLAATAGHGEPRLFGQAASARSLRMTWLNTALHDRPAELRMGTLSPFDDRFVGETFDIIVANPPFNVAQQDFTRRSWPFGKPHNANFAWLQHIVGKLAPRGRAAVLMPNMTVMARGAQDVAVRREMVEAGVVDAVVALPPNLFQSTTIPTTLWILRGIDPESSPSEVHLVDATTAGRMIDGTHRVLDEGDLEKIMREQRDQPLVGLDEIRANDYVLHAPIYRRPASSRSEKDINAEVESLTRQLDHLRARAERTELDPRLAAASITSGGHVSWEEVPLKELCDVLAGPAKVDRGGTETPRTPLVLPRNIRAGRIIHERLDTVPPAMADRNVRYQLAAGDIVCIRTGTLGRYGRVRDTEVGWLVGPGCMRLRPTPAVDAGYLTHYLGAPDAYQWLVEHATGSVIRHVNTSTLQQLPVLLPPLPVQREIAAAIDMFDEQLATHEQISKTGEKLRNLIIPMLTANTR